MKRKAKKAADYFFTYLLLIVIAIICAGPFIWLLLSSLRTGANIYNLHFSISDFSFSNYTGVMEYMNLPKYIWNTVIITFGGIIIDVVFSSLCAYPLATMEFKGKNIIFTILVGTMIIPAAAGMIINYLIITKMHLLNTMLGVILPSSTKAFSIILLRQAYLGIPKELIEAAKLDGAGELKIWKNVMIPGILPSVSTIVIFDFIANKRLLNRGDAGAAAPASLFASADPERLVPPAVKSTRCCVCRPVSLVKTTKTEFTIC